MRSEKMRCFRERLEKIADDKIKSPLKNNQDLESIIQDLKEHFCSADLVIYACLCALVKSIEYHREILNQLDENMLFDEILSDIDIKILLPFINQFRAINGGLWQESE